MPSASRYHQPTSINYWTRVWGVTDRDLMRDVTLVGEDSRDVRLEWRRNRKK
ncbi:DUF3606 domain-containing protein [Luteibacter pinisoli]|uniref:DUF3606 domain-containing protein n=1 Tax=Luteibacter pinisoli TaxID=2589080 RepID=A0A4Y5Z8K4_9GAMM|nr:DUF3606 domain-containing protein [Luteibacter pinisoli]